MIGADWLGYLVDASAPVAGLVGVVVGALLTSRTQESHWLKQLRLSAFLEVDSAARLVLFRGAEIGRPPMGGGTVDLVVQRAAMRDAMMLLRDAVSRVNLIAEVDARRAARRLLASFQAQAFPYFMSSDLPDEGSDEIQHARGRMIEFNEAAQKDLGLIRSLERSESD